MNESKIENPTNCPLVSIYDMLCYLSTHRDEFPQSFLDRFTDHEINAARFFVFSVNHNVEDFKSTLSKIGVNI